MVCFTSDFLRFHRTKFKVMSEMEMREGGTLGALSNHRMTVNHHCRALKGKDNSKYCRISSSDREVLIL